MVEVVRETFQERYDRYCSDGLEECRGYMTERLKYMEPERLAYLLAMDDKFGRIGCAEFEGDDDPDIGTNGVDPLGRIVDPWGRPMGGTKQIHDLSYDNIPKRK